MTDNWQPDVAQLSFSLFLYCFLRNFSLMFNVFNRKFTIHFNYFRKGFTSLQNCQLFLWLFYLRFLHLVSTCIERTLNFGQIASNSTQKILFSASIWQKTFQFNLNFFTKLFWILSIGSSISTYLYLFIYILSS